MRLTTVLAHPKSLWLRIPLWVVVASVLIAGGRFVFDLVIPYRPKPLAEVAFLDHAVSDTIGPVRVTVSALSPQESHAVFGVPMALQGIQPVWLEVVNGDSVPLLYMRAGTDPEWFSPFEVYWLSRFRAPRAANRRLLSRLYELLFTNPVRPGGTEAGFVFTRLDEGVKSIDLDLVGIGEVVYNFNFSATVPGFRGDYETMLGRELYPSDAIVWLESERELRAALERLPCCTMNAAADRLGDPLNLVLIGERGQVFPALSRRGWQPTEQTYAGAVWRTIRSFILRSRYRYSPVSPLYVFGRRQDLSAQKARGTIHLRNHARFWETPLRYRGDRVWIGQVSRDIGVRFIAAIPPTTHKVDPDVDEARDGFIQEMGYSQALARFAYVKGVGAARRDVPRANLTGDPYFTDGYRAVLFFEPRPRTLAEVDYLEWEQHRAMKVPPDVPQPR
jgi:hypothetical protein